MNVLPKVVGFAKANSTTILVAAGSAGFIATIALSSTATLKASAVLSEQKPETKLDVVKLTWKFYVPAALVGVGALGCFICAQRINLTRNAALATAYTVAQSAADVYKTKVVDLIGDKKEQKIRSEIAQDKLDRSGNVPKNLPRSEVFVVGPGNQLCMEATTQRYFESDMESLRSIENDVNHALINGTWLSLNDVYGALGLTPTSIGDVLGWNPDQLVEFTKDAGIAPDGRPCIVVGYKKDPGPDYYK